jgi:hypothetical protein
MNDIDLERKLNEITKKLEEVISKLNSITIETLAKDIMTARQCMFVTKGVHCNNEECSDESCPLHRRWRD